MSTPRIRVEHCLPSAASVRQAVRAFCRKPGTVTAFSDDRLRMLKDLFDEDAEVQLVPFGELVGRACLVAGEATLRQARGGQVRAAFELACEALPDGTPFSASARRPGLHERLVKTVQELRHHRIGPDDLREASRQAARGLQAKLASLADLIDDAVARLAASGTEFASARMERLMETAPPDLSALGRVFVLAGSEELPLYTQFLEWLASGGAVVQVGVEHLGESSPLFAGGKAVARALAGQAPEPGTRPWYAALFETEPALTEPLAVRVSSASDPLAECEWALRGCIDAIGQGILPHRIAVIARDSETYAPLLTLSAARLGVPLNASVRVPLSTVGFASLSQALISALASSDVRDLATVANSSYFGLGTEARQQVREAIAIASREPRRAWEVLAEWAEGEGEDRAGWLRMVLRWREESAAEPAPLAQWIERLRALWQVPPLPDSVATGENPTHERDVRARNAMERALVDRALVEDPRRERPVALASFARFCERLWAEEEVVLPAAQPNGVHLATSPESLGECEAAFVLGMLEGVIPRRRSEDPILSDEERIELGRLLPDRPPLPTSFDQARSERDLFVRMCASATKMLSFTYPQVDEERDNVPAFYLTHISRIFSSSVLQDFPRSLVAPLSDDCRSPADLALRQALDGPRTVPTPDGIVSDAAREAVAAPLGDGIEVREFDAVRSCPFMSTCRHRLRLFPSARRTAWTRLRKLPAQAGLAVQPDAESARQALEKSLEEDREGLLGVVDEWELKLLESAGRRLIPGLVQREFRAREVWHQGGARRTADVQFSGEGFRDTIPVSGRPVRIRGGAPAMSQITGYRVLHLFESSVPDEKRSDESVLERFRFRLGLTLLPAYSPDGVAAEVDGMNGARMLFVVPRKTGSMPPSDVASKLTVSVLDETLADFFGDVKRKLAEAVEALAEPKMEIRPGDACDRCDYGELCRFSKVFGEPIERFGPDEPAGMEEGE